MRSLRLIGLAALALAALLLSGCAEPSEIATRVVGTARAGTSGGGTPSATQSLPMLVRTPQVEGGPATGRTAPEGPLTQNEARDVVIEYFEQNRLAGASRFEVLDVVLVGTSAPNVVVYAASLQVELAQGQAPGDWQNGTNQRFVSLRLEGDDWRVADVSPTAPPIATPATGIQTPVAGTQVPAGQPPATPKP